MEKVANLLSSKIERLTGSSGTSTSNGNSLHQAPNATVSLKTSRNSHTGSITFELVYETQLNHTSRSLFLILGIKIGSSLHDSRTIKSYHK